MISKIYINIKNKKIKLFKVFISIASKLDQNPKKFSTPGSQTTYYFKELDAAVHYNVTVQGLSQNKKLWFISGIFATTDISKFYKLNLTFLFYLKIYNY